MLTNPDLNPEQPALTTPVHYPDIDPVIVALGPLAVRWYGLAYLIGFALCWMLGQWRARRPNLRRPGDDWDPEEIGDLVFYGAMGAVLGGRVGYVLFYAFDQFLADPLFLLRIWQGGMAFHGGLLGALIGLWLFARSTGRSLFQVTDFLCPLAPPGLGLGRLGNFANTELPGRATDSAFGLVYPCSADAVRALNPLCTGQWESFARHPSPLYQAFAEGVILFVVVWIFARKPRSLGAVTGVFLMTYGLLRMGTEFFREPDAHLGFIFLEAVSMGQLLSLPMVLLGLLLLWRPGRKASAT